jgi:hypothetical protein
VTVKLDADQLRQILAAKVAALPIAAEKKESAMDKIRSLPADILNNLVMKLVERGIEHFPDLLDLIHNASSTAPSNLPPGTIV